MRRRLALLPYRMGMNQLIALDLAAAQAYYSKDCLYLARLLSPVMSELPVIEAEVNANGWVLCRTNNRPRERVPVSEVYEMVRMRSVRAGDRVSVVDIARKLPGLRYVVYVEPGFAMTITRRSLDRYSFIVAARLYYSNGVAFVLPR